MRSRLLGLITVCIGTGPLGQLLIGALADRYGVLPAVEIMAGCGALAILGIGLAWGAAERRWHRRWRSTARQSNKEAARQRGKLLLAASLPLCSTSFYDRAAANSAVTAPRSNPISVEMHSARNPRPSAAFASAPLPASQPNGLPAACAAASSSASIA